MSNGKFVKGDKVLWKDHRNYIVAGVIVGESRSEPGYYDVDVNGRIVLAPAEDLKRNGRL